jgi:hypothetical protein
MLLLRARDTWTYTVTGDATQWNPTKFYGVGTAAAAGVASAFLLGHPVAAAVCAIPVLGFWSVSIPPFLSPFVRPFPQNNPTRQITVCI